jgi:hypothetical protein
MTQIIETTLQSERERLLAERVEDINEAQGKLVQCAKTVGNGLLAGANYRRALGEKLAALKDAKTSEGHRVVPHGDWEGLFASDSNSRPNRTAVFGFTPVTARRYIAFAESHPNPIESLDEIARDSKDLLLAAGEIEESGGGNPGNKAGGNASWITFLTKGTEQINKLKEQAPVDEWPQTTRSTMKEKLRPWVELYELL